MAFLVQLTLLLIRTYYKLYISKVGEMMLNGGFTSIPWVLLSILRLMYLMSSFLYAPPTGLILQWKIGEAATELTFLANLHSG